MFFPYNAPHIELLNAYLGYCFASITGIRSGPDLMLDSLFSLY